jgi:hypothetical protein
VVEKLFDGDKSVLMKNKKEDMGRCFSATMQ